MKYPTELHKGIERTKQTLALDTRREGIKTYGDKQKLDYMSATLSLAQPEFRRVKVADKQSPLSNSPSKVFDESFQPLSQAALALMQNIENRQMMISKQEREKHREEIRNEFLKKQKKDQEEYRRMLSNRLGVSDILKSKLHEGGNLKLSPTNHIYGAYKQPSKFVVRRPIDQIGCLLKQRDYSPETSNNYFDYI